MSTGSAFCGSWLDAVVGQRFEDARAISVVLSPGSRCDDFWRSAPGSNAVALKDGAGMAQEPEPKVRGPKKGIIKQSEFVHDDFDGLSWGECEEGVQHAVTTRELKSGATVEAIAERPCRECTSSGCPWRADYNYFVNGG